MYIFIKFNYLIPLIFKSRFKVFLIILHIFVQFNNLIRLIFKSHFGISLSLFRLILNYFIILLFINFQIFKRLTINFHFTSGIIFHFLLITITYLIHYCLITFILIISHKLSMYYFIFQYPAIILKLVFNLPHYFVNNFHFYTLI